MTTKSDASDWVTWPQSQTLQTVKWQSPLQTDCQKTTKSNASDWQSNDHKVWCFRLSHMTCSLTTSSFHLKSFCLLSC